MRTVCSCIALALSLGCSGCIVQSLHPFYTDASKTSPPGLAGEWDFIKSGSDDLSTKKIKPWAFSESSSERYDYDVVSYNQENVPGKLKAVFFKVGDSTFCDFDAGDLPSNAGVNEYWVLNVRPVHTVAKAEIKGDLLTFKALDYEWVSKGLEKKELTIPFLKATGDDDGLPLFTATPQEWEKFLKQYGSNTNAFPEKSASVLKKRKINDKDEAKDQPKQTPPPSK